MKFGIQVIVILLVGTLAHTSPTCEGTEVIKLKCSGEFCGEGSFVFKVPNSDLKFLDCRSAQIVTKFRKASTQKRMELLEKALNASPLELSLYAESSCRDSKEVQDFIAKNESKAIFQIGLHAANQLNGQEEARKTTEYMMYGWRCKISLKYWKIQELEINGVRQLKPAGTR